MTRRLSVILGVATAIVFAVGVAAWAFFTATASATQPASSSSLGAPASASAAAASPTSITVTVTTGPSNPAASGYTVYPHGSTATPACTISGSTGNCAVTGRNPGTAYSFDVYSTLANWISSASVTVVATTPPATPSAVSLVGGGTGSAFVNAANQSSVEVDVSLPSTSLATDSVHLTVSDGTTTVTPTAKPAPSGSGITTFPGLNLAGLTNGPLTLTAWVTDTGGASTNATASAIKDPVAPAPAVTTPTANSYPNSTTPTFTGTAGTQAGDGAHSADSATVTVAVYAGATATGSPLQTLTTTATSGTWSVSPSALTGGAQYTIQASQSDSAGNSASSSARSFTIDTAAPSPAVTTPATASYTNATTPAISGTAGTQSADTTHSADASTVTVKIFSGSATTGSALQTFNSVAVTSGSWTVSESALTANAQYTVQVTQADGTGNVGSATSTFVIDSAAPAVAVTSPTSGSTTSGTTPTFTGTAGSQAADTTHSADASTVTVKVYAGTTATGSPVQTLSSPTSSSAWSVAASSALTAGSQYTVQATQTDGAGNTGTSTAVTFTAGNPAPAGLTFVNVLASASSASYTPTVSCSFVLVSYKCTISPEVPTGNSRTLTAQVALMDSGGHVIANNTGSAITVVLVATGSGKKDLSPGTVTIPAGSSSSGSFTLTLTNGSSEQGTVTATAIVGLSTYISSITS